MKYLIPNSCLFFGDKEIPLYQKDLLQYYLAQEMESQLKIENDLFFVVGLQGFAKMVLLTAFTFRRFYPKMKIILLVTNNDHNLTFLLKDLQIEERFFTQQIDSILFMEAESDFYQQRKRYFHLIKPFCWTIVYCQHPTEWMIQTIKQKVRGNFLFAI